MEPRIDSFELSIGDEIGFGLGVSPTCCDDGMFEKRIGDGFEYVCGTCRTVLKTNAVGLVSDIY
jgi:hypothetical protein